MKHILLKSENDRRELAWKYIDFRINSKQIWKDEDYPLLKPFFDYSNALYVSGKNPKQTMSPEISKSFDYYEKCRKEYADELFYLRDAVKEINSGDLCRSFGYNYNDDEGLMKKINLIDEIPELSYPVIAVLYIESSYDRNGPMGTCIVEYVELKEFSKEG